MKIFIYSITFSKRQYYGYQALKSYISDNISAINT